MIIILIAVSGINKTVNKKMENVRWGNYEKEENDNKDKEDE